MKGVHCKRNAGKVLVGGRRASCSSSCAAQPLTVWPSSHVPVCQVQALDKASRNCQPGPVCKQVQADCMIRAHAGHMRSDSKLLCAPSLQPDCAVLLCCAAELLLCATCHLPATTLGEWQPGKT
jgi:hypothetical protein